MAEVIRKHRLDMKVAELLGLTTREVAAVTAAFLKETIHALVEHEYVRLDGLGELHVNCRRGRRALWHRTTFKGKKSVVAVSAKYYVSFKKAQPLARAIRQRHPGKKGTRMEKFGVDEGTDQESLEKAAAEGCPQCGKKPVRYGKVLMCPDHGSEPFEKKTQ